MKRRAFVVAIGAAMASPAALFAQSSVALQRIGFLSARGAAKSPELALLRDALRDRGYVEKRNLLIEFGTAEELARGEVQAIVAAGTAALSAAKAATSTVPIVAVGVPDPVAEGNVTGAGYDTAGLSARLVEVFPQVVPGATPLALLRNPDSPNAAQQLRSADATARVRGMYVQAFDVRALGDLEAAFVAMKRRGMQGVVILDDRLFARNATQLAELALGAGLPSIHDDRTFPEAGGLMSYGPHPTQAWRVAAVFVDRILRGAAPADLPVELATQFELVINATTARALGVAIPAGVPGRAHKVIP